MKQNRQQPFNKLEMMMLMDSDRSLVFKNELMIDDNFDKPISQEDRDKYMTSVYPFKLMFMMIILGLKGIVGILLLLSNE